MIELILNIIVIVATGVIIRNLNPIYSILNLILIYGCYACLLVKLELEFLACIIILVNVGAIAVLFLFIVMMININIIEIKETIKKYKLFLNIGLIGIFAIIVLLCMNMFIIKKEDVLSFILDIILAVKNNIKGHYININTPLIIEDNIKNILINNIKNIDNIQLLNTNIDVKNASIDIISIINIIKETLNINYVNIYDSFIEKIDIKSIGSNILYGIHSIWFIIAGIILLIAMIGVIYITENLLQMRKNENKTQDIGSQVSREVKEGIKLYNTKFDRGRCSQK